MFTVCPKCALTLVVTAADLKVAQGYVRCGRCSNVFNAIVALSEDRGGQQGSSSSSGASTTVIRKAPSISDDPPPDPLSDTGESEAIYAEPEADPEEVKFQEVFVEPESFVNRPAARTPPASPTPPTPAPRAPAPAPKPPTPPSKPAAKSAEPRYDDDSDVPDEALEFNPAETDVTKLFVDPAPVRKIDMTGTHEKLVLKAEDEPTAAIPVPTSSPSPPARAPTPPASTRSSPPPARTSQRDAEDEEIENQLRSLAAKLDATGSQPALKRTAGNASSGSPYNSADEPTNLALKAAKARRVTPPPEEDALVNEADAAAAEVAASQLTGPPPSRRRRIAWIAGSLGLVVVLGAQAIHHNRNDLATDSRFTRPLTRFYEAIGAPLVPNWNPGSFDVRQLGASTGNGDTGNLTVRASLKNAADQPLPLPLLRITVQDRYGNRIATRDVPPSGYMPGAVPEGARLGAGQRIDAEMTFKDPGREAVGFEIDACLPQASGRIACAND
jgi:predicted Zn finger-like uncharacterized protein